MFLDTVGKKWIDHLGRAANRDPKDCELDDLPGWYPAIDLINGLEIPAFKTGLTTMQTVNTLAICGVVKMATTEEMGRWISQNRGLGAVKGLALLGFTVKTAIEIEGAFICFHNYLESKLTPEDMKDIGFHPPFTEHVLCKTPRWNQYLRDDKCPTLVEMASELGNIMDLRSEPHRFRCHAIPLDSAAGGPRTRIEES